MVDGPPVLLFQHLPKTAGTSLRHALAAVYTPDERAFIYDPEDLAGAVSAQQFRSVPEPQRERLRLVIGHFAYGLHTALDQPCTYATILREPVDRVVSLYFHFKLMARPNAESKGARERSRIEEGDLSLEQWVFDGDQLQADNGMVRQIAPRPGIRFGACPDDLLTEALEHVEADYAAVLVQGLMARGVEVLAGILGRPLPPLPQRNVNVHREPLARIDPDVRRRIYELNALDVRLFQAMLARFPETYERYAR